MIILVMVNAQYVFMTFHRGYSLGLQPNREGDSWPFLIYKCNLKKILKHQGIQGKN